MKIEIKNYSKTIKKKQVLNKINYTFEGNRIYGLIGRNGSGKTMLLRAIAGLIFPAEGEIVIDDKILYKDIGFPESLGLIIEKTELLPEYTGFKNLKILSRIKKVATDDDIKKAIISVGLDPEDKKKVYAYSLGMKQKLSIAQAIFEHPKLLLLDEPTNALDEKSVENVRSLLLEEKKRGVLTIIASHNKEDIEFLSDEVIKIDNGEIEQK